eukprot:TRINITY_DN217_c0_g1_i1.p1 TRINITY_DN217_c0_g1~~TRINITY_DN217_c0_g1_i1.p1  ORF type:complete len:386 (-),score=74.89 TRINITY_DN217_c0_g1_i1:178-1335(-)
MRSITGLLLLAIACLLLVLVCTPSTLVDAKNSGDDTPAPVSKDGDDDDGDHHGPGSRQLRVDVDDDKIDVRGTGATDDSELRFRMRTLEDGNDLFRADFEWKFENKTGSKRDDDGTKQELRFLFRMLNVIEYLEVNGEAGFQPQGSQDRVLSSYGATRTSGPGSNSRKGPSHKAQWQDWTVDAPVTDVSGAVVYGFSATTEDDVIYVQGTISSQATSFNNVDLNPDNVKIDIQVADYPFTLSSNKSHIAIVAIVRAEARFEDDHDRSKDNKQVHISGDFASTVTAILGWAPTVQVDDTAYNVVATQLIRTTEDDNGSDDKKRADDDGDDSDISGDQYLVIFSFPVHGKTYYWDPTVGVSYDPADAVAKNPDSAASHLGAFWSLLL